jgi:hypothetical protein
MSVHEITGKVSSLGKEVKKLNRIIKTKDDMIKHLQLKSTPENQPFQWYAWNGTHYPCDYNKMPISIEQCKNTGLVFQDTRLPTTVQGTYTFHENNAYVFSESARPLQKPLRFF